MGTSLILASGSSIRRTLLENAGIVVEVCPAKVDEEAIRAALLAEGASPRDQADALAEYKARQISNRYPDIPVLGCDQILEFSGQTLSKVDSIDAARAQLKQLRGKQHSLLSAAVIYDQGQPVWRHVGQVRLTMRQFSDDYLESYLSRNWPAVQSSVGCYMLEHEGVRLFTRVDGDYFTVLGLPLLQLLDYLTANGVIDS